MNYQIIIINYKIRNKKSGINHNFKLYNIYNNTKNVEYRFKQIPMSKKGRYEIIRYEFD